MHAAVLCFIYFVLYLLRLTVDNYYNFDYKIFDPLSTKALLDVVWVELY